MNNIIGITISIGFILLVLGIAALLAKYTASESELSRKTVHILVGNWVFIAFRAFYLRYCELDKQRKASF